MKCPKQWMRMYSAPHTNDKPVAIVHLDLADIELRLLAQLNDKKVDTHGKGKD